MHSSLLSRQKSEVSTDTPEFLLNQIPEST